MLSTTGIACAYVIGMAVNNGYGHVSSECAKSLDPNIMSYMLMVFLSIGPIMFGTLWDAAKGQVDLAVKFIILLSWIIMYIGYLLDGPRIMGFAYLLLCISGLSLFSNTCALINDTYTKNKIGGMCAFWFFYYVGRLFMYSFFYLFG